VCQLDDVERETYKAKETFSGFFEFPLLNSVTRPQSDRTKLAAKLERKPISRLALRRVLVMVLVAGLSLPLLAQTTAPAADISGIQAALRSDDNSAAVTLAKEQIQKFPNDARVWTLEGVAYTRLKKNREALAAYNKALAIHPDFLPALEGAVQIEYAAGSDRAVSLLNRILKLRPDETTAHAMLTTLALKKHDCRTSVDHFHQAGTALSAQQDTMQRYGACLLELDKPEEALAVFQQLLDAAPDNQHARYNLAVAQLAATHTQEAIATLQPLLNDAQPDPDTMELASSAYEEQGDTPRSVALLRQAIVANPKNAKYYVDFAVLSYKHQSFDAGVEMLNAGISQLPNTSSLYIARGILLIQMGQFDKGQADFETANRLDPKQASASVAEGLAQFQHSDLGQALKTVDAQLKIHPNDAFLHYLRAEILTQGGAQAGSAQFNEAVQSALRAVQLEPKFPLAHNLLGTLYFESGQNERAIAQCRLVLRENPDDQVALYHLLLALRKTKDPNQEIPGLVKRLADLRVQSHIDEGTANKYKLYIPKDNASSEPATPANP
jgi:tetratricopeptide (TPR) repeat protein